MWTGEELSPLDRGFQLTFGAVGGAFDLGGAGLRLGNLSKSFPSVTNALEGVSAPQVTSTSGRLGLSTEGGSIKLGGTPEQQPKAKLNAAPEGTVPKAHKSYTSTPEVRKQFREFFGEPRYNQYSKEIDKLKLVHPELSNIPMEDLVAVRGYTSSDYSMLNKALRSGDPAELKRLNAYIKSAESGLSQLPSYQGSVFRGTNLSSEAASKYKPGQTVTEDFFFSTAANPRGAFPGNTQYTIRSSNGKRIEFLSEVSYEKEVLFPPGTNFKVLSVKIDPDTGTRKIIMIEINKNNDIQR
jgi:hypothetical protein